MRAIALLALVPSVAGIKAFSEHMVDFLHALQGVDHDPSAEQLEIPDAPKESASQTELIPPHD